MADKDAKEEAKLLSLLVEQGRGNGDGPQDVKEVEQNGE